MDNKKYIDDIVSELFPNVYDELIYIYAKIVIDKCFKAAKDLGEFNESDLKLESDKQESMFKILQAKEFLVQGSIKEYAFKEGVIPLT